MCGIGGVWCLNREKLDRSDAKKLRDLAIFLQTRGKDAFGFYNGDKVIKFPSSASDVIAMIDRIRPFHELVIDKSMFLMHTRAYTNGDPLRNKNNHPFELKDIVFAHNGVLWDYVIYQDIRFDGFDKGGNVEYIDTYELFGNIEIDLPETDSFEIGVEIQREYNKSNDFTKALENALSYLVYFGDMALWVYSKKEDLLALFRCERPLYIGFDNSKLWFASEDWMLKKIRIKNIRALREGELLIYSRKGTYYLDFINELEDISRKETKRASRRNNYRDDDWWREYRHYDYDYWRLYY